MTPPCKHCGEEIHKGWSAALSTQISDEIMPLPSETFPFHRRCFFFWVYKKLDQQ